MLMRQLFPKNGSLNYVLTIHNLLDFLGFFVLIFKNSIQKNNQFVLNFLFEKIQHYNLKNNNENILGDKI